MDRVKVVFIVKIFLVSTADDMHRIKNTARTLIIIINNHNLVRENIRVPNNDSALISIVFQLMF